MMSGEDQQRLTIVDDLLLLSTLGFQLFGGHFRILSKWYLVLLLFLRRLPISRLSLSGRLCCTHLEMQSLLLLQLNEPRREELVVISAEEDQRNVPQLQAKLHAHPTPGALGPRARLTGAPLTRPGPPVLSAPR